MAVTDPYAQRVAWLTLADGTQPLYLDDWTAGYACTELDLGWPQVRDVVTNRPDAHGTDDRTKLWGSRVVTAHLEAWPGGTLTVDQVVELFGPYLDPGTRPQLHFASSATPERVITLRPNQFSSPMGSKPERKLQLTWVAPDPLLYGATLRTGTVIPDVGSAGRVYNLTFDRAYPPGGQGGTILTVTNNGDQPAWPVITVYGPATYPQVEIDYYSGPGGTVNQGRLYVPFLPTYRLNAGEWVVLDTRARAAWFKGDTTASVVGYIDQANAVWAPIPPVGANNAFGWFAMLGSSMAGSVTHADIAWREAYLL